mmetsp:Transcript_12599/g.25522  ORF Transcript_12599/g.25522 Transcript_12599/m.25522 type:complete len:554 (-) Transcript_12599:259-1920(-)
MARGKNPSAEMFVDIYESCTASLAAASNGDIDTTTSTPDANQVWQCASQILSRETGSREFARKVLLIYSAALVFFMQAGFAMVCAGAVRKKNVQNTMLKNLLDACGASLAFFTIGYAFAFGGSDYESPEKTFVGRKNFFLMDVDDYAFFLFQYAFSAASATIVAGTLAERCQMAAYLCYSFMLTGWVYPVVCHSIWSPNGFLSANSIDPLWGVGMVDFAGSGVVHTTGGITALFATIILGPRRGRFHDEEGRRLDTPREIPGHSMALQMLGTFILWFGWYGFNCGTAILSDGPRTEDVASLAAVNTTLAAAAAGVTSLLVNLFILDRKTGEALFDLKFLMNGTLSGLVAITAGCGVLEPWGAVIVGCVAGLIYIAGSNGLVALRLDDAVDAIPVHFLNGAWGLISVGLLASPRHLLVAYGRNNHPGLVYSWEQGQSDATLLAAQLVGLLFIMGWVLVIMFPFFIWLDWKGWFRADALEEIVGLDTSYHGGLALLADDGGGVNPEYISAYKQKKQEKLMSRNPRIAVSDTVVGDSVAAHEDHDHSDHDGELPSP